MAFSSVALPNRIGPARVLYEDVPVSAEMAQTALWQSLLDALPIGILTLDAELHILHKNAAAATMLKREEGLREYEGQLRASTAHSSFLLISTVRKLSAMRETHRGAAPVSFLRVPQRSMLHDMEVVFKQAPGATLGQAQRTTVIAYVCDPDRTRTHSQQLVANLYRLTPAETQLTLHLMQGLSLEDAAEVLRVKKDTVRKHLQAIFAKTQTSRQSDLVRLLLTSIAQLEI